MRGNRIAYDGTLPDILGNLTHLDFYKKTLHPATFVNSAKCEKRQDLHRHVNLSNCHTGSSAVVKVCQLLNLIQFLVRDAFPRTNRRAIAMMFVRQSVCLGRACIVIIRMHFSGI